MSALRWPALSAGEEEGPSCMSELNSLSGLALYASRPIWF
jgi:hypothetical protein